VVSTNLQLKIKFIENDNPLQNPHPRIKRNWPFKSSQDNANIINSYYQAQPGDSKFVKHIQKPFARYVGRAFGDEFPKVRDSLIDYQNRGYSFTMAHMPWNGWKPANWVRNPNNDELERTNPYNSINEYGGSSFLNKHAQPYYRFFRRNGN
jgi:hypothetical protein